MVVVVFVEGDGVMVVWVYFQVYVGVVVVLCGLFGGFQQFLVEVDVVGVWVDGDGVEVGQ